MCSCIWVWALVKYFILFCRDKSPSPSSSRVDPSQWQSRFGNVEVAKPAGAAGAAQLRHTAHYPNVCKRINWIFGLLRSVSQIYKVSFIYRNSGKVLNIQFSFCLYAVLFCYYIFWKRYFYTTVVKLTCNGTRLNSWHVIWLRAVFSVLVSYNRNILLSYR